jgi:predicted lipoprotein with Yx(FWY)xxD motif
MRRLLIPGIAVAVVVAAALAVAGCGGGGDDNSPSAATPAMSSATVATQEIGGDDVVVDSSDKALYASDQETAAGKVLCMDACTSFWEPLTVNGAPTGSSVSGKLGVVTRPDGNRQVTLDGKLLYTFVQDQPGEVTGDGFEDAFGGQTLRWHVVHPDGTTGSTGTSSSGGLGY